MKRRPLALIEVVAGIGGSQLKDGALGEFGWYVQHQPPMSNLCSQRSHRETSNHPPHRRPIPPLGVPTRRSQGSRRRCTRGQAPTFYFARYRAVTAPPLIAPPVNPA